MTMGRVDKNSTHEEIELGEKLQLHRADEISHSYLSGFVCPSGL
jgi:hypothetical protein